MLSRIVRRVRRSGDAGITLTELVVTMSLLSIVGALALTALIGTSTSSDQTTEAGLATATARTAMSSWTNFLQVAAVPAADPMIRNLAITATSISFNAQLDNLPGCTDQCASNPATAVLLELKNVDAAGRGQLVQTLTRGNDVQTLTLVPSGVAVPKDGCLFHAYKADGVDLTCVPLPAAASTPVDRVDIAFTMTPAAGTAQSFYSSAKLPGGAT